MLVKCMRVESSRPIRQADGQTAYIHLARDLTAGGSPLPRRRPSEAPPRRTPAQWRELARRQRQDLPSARLASLSRSLGVSERSLLAYGVGWEESSGAAAFPMFDGTREKDGGPWSVCGIRLRDDRGRKRCVLGSRNGLFLPADYEAAEVPAAFDSPGGPPLLLLTPEGPTDCCAAFDCGFRAVGRPSNGGGAEMLRTLLARGAKQDVVVVADRDEAKYLPDGVPFWPGIEGAVSLCEAIVRSCASLRFCLPPVGTKDLRQWLIDGGTGRVMADVFAASPVVTPGWLARARKRLAGRKRSERRRDTAA